MLGNRFYDPPFLLGRQGRGTFVARHDSGAQEFRFSNILNRRNENITTIRTRISFRIDDRPVEIRRRRFDGMEYHSLVSG